MKFARAKLVLALALPGCMVVVGCSNSSTNGPTVTSYPDGGYEAGPIGTVSATNVSGLNTVIAQGNATTSTATDKDTLRVAAEIEDLEYDRKVQLGTAAMLLTSESEPKYAPNAAKLEAARQAALTQAASDLTKIQAFQQTSVPGKATLNTDGGASAVIDALIAKTYATRAQQILNLAAQGGKVPTNDQVSLFLQQIALVTEDDGPGGHTVAERLVVRDVLSDGGLKYTDGGVR
jgi:hypothetical protein